MVCCNVRTWASSPPGEICAVVIRAHVRQTIGTRRRVAGEGGAVEGADGGAGDEVRRDVVL